MPEQWITGSPPHRALSSGAPETKSACTCVSSTCAMRKPSLRAVWTYSSTSRVGSITAHSLVFSSPTMYEAIARPGMNRWWKNMPIGPFLARLARLPVALPQRHEDVEGGDDDDHDREHALEPRRRHAPADEGPHGHAGDAADDEQHRHAQRERLLLLAQVLCDAGDADQRDHEQRGRNRAVDVHPADEHQRRHDDEAAADAEEPGQHA